jgi:DNA-binding NtrC family response regulator
MARILIAEDDPQVRGMLRTTLERAGHEVREAGDGREALRVCAEGPVDIVVTDLIMPEMEGIATIRALRQAHPGMKIIAMSGGGYIGPQSYLDAARKCGAAYAFSKPVDRETLLAAIGQLAA